MKASALAWALALLVAGACGSDDGAKDALDTPEDSAADSAADTGTDSAGEVADTAPGACPLTAAERARVETIVQTAVFDAGWIVDGTHGSGVFAGRAWGLALPFTELALLYHASLAEACTAAHPFDPYCEEPEPGGPDPAVSKCTQLECLDAGVLQARAWLEGLPLTLATTTGEGDLTLSALDARSVTAELASGDLDLSWTGSYAIAWADGAELAVTATGTAAISGDTHEPTLAVSIVAGGWTFTIAIASGSAGHEAGTGSVAGSDVLTLSDGGFTWLGGCAAP